MVMTMQNEGGVRRALWRRSTERRTKSEVKDVDGNRQQQQKTAKTRW